MDLKELKSLQGRKRVLLIHSQEGVYLNNQRELFDRVPEEYQDRDLLIVTDIKKDILNKYDMRGDFDIVLIGKDGGEKYKGHGVTNPEKIYSIIDRMPERQSEMRP